MIRKLSILAAIAAAVAVTALGADASRVSAAPIIVLPTLAQPDLVVDSVTTSPPYTSLAKIAIKNVPAPTSLTTSAGPFIVRLSSWTYVDCWMFCQSTGWTQVGSSQSVSIGSLAAGATVSLWFPSNFGDWVKVEVDPTNQVTERDETNNTWFGQPTYNY